MLSTLKSGPNMRLRFRVKTGTNPSSGTSTLIASSGNLHVDKWIFATAVYNGTHMILYKDGIKVGKTAKTGTLATSSSVEAWIGDNPSAGGKEFDGRIDEVAIFDRALSPDEVADLYYDTRFGIYNYLPDIHDRPSINLYHDGDASELIVWGGAPAMANNATIYIYELDGTEYHSQTETVGMQGEHAKAYRAEVDISSWDPEKYNVVVKFYNSTDGYMDGYDVGDLFDDLL